MKLSQEKQISYRSAGEIVSKLDFAAARLALHTKFAGAKLRTGHVVNALALWLGNLPDDELREFVEPKLKELEEFLGRSEEAGPPPSAHSEEPRSTVVRYSREFPDPPEDAGQGLNGDDAPARKPRKAPARKRGS